MNLDWLVAFLLLLGAFFMLVSTIGLLRMPDLLTRMHATTKAGAFGSGLMLLAVALFFTEIGVTTRVVAIILFIILTAPIGAHVVGRAAYIRGISLWPGTLYDQLQGHYNIESGHLSSTEPAADTATEASKEQPTPS